MAYDAIVIGGSFAGVSAAMPLARARRSVLIIDAGRPRNRFASHSHGFFAQDGAPPLALIAAGRDKVLSYPSVRLVHGEATRAERLPDGTFAVEVSEGERFRGSKLLIASGVVDDLPDIDGLAERWGKTVMLCPYCHGYEFGGEQLGVLYGGPMSAHQAALLADWGEVTLFTQGHGLDADAHAMLASRHVHVEPSEVVALLGVVPKLSGVRLASGRVVPIVALFVSSRQRMASPIAEQLGCAFDPGPFGPVLRTDDMRLSSVPGVYAAGDVARAMSNATSAAFDGMTAGVSIHRALVFGEPPHR